MPNVYIEPRPKGRKEGELIEDYVVEDHKDHVLKTFKTQKEAIDWAKKEGTIPSSPASGTRTTRRSSITGDRRAEASPVACRAGSLTPPAPGQRSGPSSSEPQGDGE